MNTDAVTEFHLPVIPYSPIDALNRRAAALGSPRYAQAAAYADYNGHCTSTHWNDYRQYYVTEYFWAGRVVLARGSFESCLREALVSYARGALGSSATVSPRADDAAAIALCEAEPKLVRGSLWVVGDDGRELNQGSWYTWRHRAAAESARDSANPRASTLIFDWELMQAADSRQDYEAALQAKYGRTYGWGVTEHRQVKKKPLFLCCEPAYVNEGEFVWVPWDRAMKSALRCVVTMAAGKHARVENAEHKFARLLPLSTLRVPHDDPRASRYHGPEGHGAAAWFGGGKSCVELESNGPMPTKDELDRRLNASEAEFKAEQ